MGCKQPLNLSGSCDQRISDLKFSVDGGATYSPVNGASVGSDGDCRDGQYLIVFADICAAFGVKTGEEVNKTVLIKGIYAGKDSSVTPRQVHFTLSGTPKNDQERPTILMVSSNSMNKTYAATDSVDMYVKFSEAVKVTGSPRLALNITNGPLTSRPAIYSTGSGTDELVFTYPVVAGDFSSDLDAFNPTSLDLNGGSLTDASMNSAVLTLPAPGSGKTLAELKNIVINTGASLDRSTVEVVPTVSADTSVVANGVATGQLDLF
jgi:hypothetical protein